MAHNLIRSFLNVPLKNHLPTLRDDLFFPLEQSFDDFFQNFFSESSLDTIKGKSGYPRLEAGVEGNHWVVRAAVPGVSYDSLNVEIEEKPNPTASTTYEQKTLEPVRVLRISGKMSEEYESPKDAKLYRKELRKSSFSREMNLPYEAEGQPEASLKDGILTLKWKLKSKEEPRTNTVKVQIRQE
jgi:HSP20 family molecular chaperone IbpA